MFEEHIHADEIHGSKGFAIVEKYCTTPELQEVALKAVEDATQKRWRYMNSICWFALHGKDDDTPQRSSSLSVTVLIWQMKSNGTRERHVCY